MITCGPWKDVRLEMYNSRISDLYAEVKLDEACKTAEVNVVVEIEAPREGLRLHGSV